MHSRPLTVSNPWLAWHMLHYVFQEQSWKRLNKSLATCLVSLFKFTHFYFSTKSCWHILLYLLWDILKICGIASTLNTHRLYYLLDLLWIKVMIYYQTRAMETTYAQFEWIAHIHIHTYICMYIYICTYICTYIYVYGFMHESIITT